MQDSIIKSYYAMWNNCKYMIFNIRTWNSGISLAKVKEDKIENGSL
jgi:hypothetical protein